MSGGKSAGRAAKAVQPPKKVTVTLVLFNWGEISTEELLGGIDGMLMAYMVRRHVLARLIVTLGR